VCVRNDRLSGSHFVEKFDCGIDVLGTNAALNETSVDNQAWLDVLTLHLFEYLECCRKVLALRVDFYKDAESHIRRLDVKRSHIRVDLESHVNFSSFATPVK